MWNLFKKKAPKKVELVAVVEGTVVALENVSDPIFSQKMMGDGIAIIPNGDVVVAPCDGEITVLPDSRHAFGMKNANGLEILVHVGIDTVNLKGEGFIAEKKVGSKVKAGEPVLRFDKEKIEAQGIDCMTMVIILNHDQYHLKSVPVNQKVHCKEDIILEVEPR